MNPSAAAISAIRSRVADWTQEDSAIAAALNAPAVANPTPQGNVPRPFSAADLVGACSQANRAALAPELAGSAAALILAQAAAPLGAGLDALATMGLISAADASAMKAVMSRTDPDPAWRSEISWAVATLGRPVDESDINASRPGV